MNNILRFMLAIIVSLCWFDSGVAQKSLDQVKVGACGTADQIKTWKDEEEKRGLVIDARPFTVNPSTGERLFTGKIGRVSVIDMNPLLYEYKISVAQQELVSTAVSDFIKQLFPKDIASLIGTQSGDVTDRAAKTISERKVPLVHRLETFKLANCKAAPAACAATQEMFDVFTEIEKKLQEPVDEAHPDQGSPKAWLEKTAIETSYDTYSANLRDAREEQLETFVACTRAEKLNSDLNEVRIGKDFERLDNAQQSIKHLTSLVDDLEQLAKDYNIDPTLREKENIVRCNGFNCTNQFLEYARVVRVMLGVYQTKLGDLRPKNLEMRNVRVLTDQMKEKDGLFARSFTIARRFELSEATIALKRTKLELGSKAGNTQSGTVVSVPGNDTATSSASSEGNVENQFGRFVPDGGVQSGTPPTQPAAPTKPANNATQLAPDVNEVIQLGRPRFMLSGGLVYSPLPRRTFKVVKGFVLDAQGNPTGNGDASVVGFEQNSPRRLFPMFFLNSRLLDYGRQGSLYFSLGITAKQDDNIDLEYLLGPTVSFLNDRALFTFGAYGGLTQNLVSDVRIGQEIPDSLGEVALFRKGLTWKPGFSFSYAFSRTKKTDKPPVISGNASPADDLKNEIRIGSIPFNLALGLAYTSLEQRTYDEIAGFARNRQGGLANGQTLARIVGVTSSSNYRLSPLAMLHSRLTNFGTHDFYFTSGITGKKTGNDFDIEYLLGGSMNLYRRKVFLTFGTFVGKQQILGGNFFEGAALSKGQNVATERRYVWKPAIAFSYDISRIIPR